MKLTFPSILKNTILNRSHSHFSELGALKSQTSPNRNRSPMIPTEQKTAARDFVAFWTGKGYEKGQTQPF